ncbi:MULTISPECIES: class I SAM-dependent methyltransferase [Microbacterium]|uniref:class I SAM-dependent methyltransferase n=1 Tax=Microbacterium TaxID=33882 RepID=UPI001CC10418|nr:MULTISPECIES: class I SAM-dependent methyltransferase [unclassified Microbacterium]
MTAQTSATSGDGTSMPSWLTPASYWLPAHFVDSAWSTHGSFAAWIVDVLRPRDVIELGTHNGFSCFAFAEAAKRMGHPITIHALDSWEGDDQAGFYDDSVYLSVRATAERDYAGSVVLHRGYFSETRPEFATASADLLHIDGRHGYEDAREDYEQWRDTVRDGGVILFHDIAERREGFGVWRLWEEIAEPGRSFTFEHGHGLGVLAVGDIAQEPLRVLFDADAGVADRIRTDFERLGAVIAEMARIPHFEAEVASLHDVVDMLQTERLRLTEVIAAQDRSIASLHGSTSWAVTAPLRAASRMIRRDR